MYIDTHCHLNFPDFEKDIDEVIKRALEKGVEKIICVSSNVDDSRKAVEIAKKYGGIVYASIGIHPQKTDPENLDSPEKQIENLRLLLKSHEITAIGECGLDYSPTLPPEIDRSKEEQFFLFGKQIIIANELKIPIIIHCRKSFEDIISILNKSYGGLLKGVFHCYSGGKKGIKKVLDSGFYFGIDGNITYDQGLQNVVQEIPLEKIVLETDAPFLSPEPFRGKRNEPANISIIAEWVAKIKEKSIVETLKIISQNTEQLFYKT